MGEPSEKDFLRYRGNHVPRFLRFAWTVLLLFSIYYLAAYAWPDLRQWLSTMK
jgi:hypothetical protein